MPSASRYLFTLLVLVSFSACHWRVREERLPDEQAGDERVFQSRRADAQLALESRLSGMEARLSELRSRTAGVPRVREDVTRMLADGSVMASEARNQLEELKAANRDNWDAIRAQTESTIKNLEDSWRDFVQQNKIQ
jgi:hypothetical protein